MTPITATATALAQRVAALETLLTGVTRTTHNGPATLRFNQVNLQLANGTNNTYTANGYGNLIVGYDGNSGDDARTGSHDIIVGDAHAWTGSGGVVFGFNNAIIEDGATVTGGGSNNANRAWSSVTGGLLNEATADYTTVSGGSVRTATSPFSWRAGDLFQAE